MSFFEGAPFDYVRFSRTTKRKAACLFVLGGLKQRDWHK